MATIAIHEHYQNPMELRWLKSFIAVAEEMHFSRAARRLHIAQNRL